MERNEKLHIVNTSVERMEVWDKVTGRAKYGADLKYPNMLYAKGVYAQYAHAKILSINTSAAEAIQGVVCVITAKDIPGLKVIGELVKDQFVMALDKTRTLGDVVATIAAETMEIAEEAAGQIKVEYEILETLFTMEKALESEELVTEDYPGNICSQCQTQKGDVDQGFSKSDVIIQTEYSTQFVEHAYIEPEAIVTVPENDGKKLTIYGSMQNPYMVRQSVCRSLNIPLAKVSTVQSTLGGSFGGKLESAEPPAVRGSLISLMTNRPVKYVLSREDSIRETHKRHPFNIKFKLGADKEGNLKALCADAMAESGAYVVMSGGVIWKAATLGAGPYKIDNQLYRARAIMTNNIQTGSMRGFGTPQAILGMENAMDELAYKLGISPYQLRRKNVLHSGDTSPCGDILDTHVVSVLEVLDKAAEAIDFDRKYERYSKENSGYIRRGMGIACSMRGVSFGAEGLDVSRVYIEVEIDGSVLVSIGLTEQGQGLRTVMAQIAAEALGVSLERITMNVADSSRAPDSGATVASRGTFMGGNAIINASDQIKDTISGALAEHYGGNKENIQFINDYVYVENQQMTFSEAVACCYSRGYTPISIGTFSNYPLNWDEAKGYGQPFATYTYSCHAAEVEVDLGTGKVEIIKLVGCHDAGRTINPEMAKGQIYGGLVMASGMALTEDLAISHGRIKNLNLDNYIIPTMMDIRESEVILVENPDQRGPFGAKSLGEPSIEPSAGAILCAINHALGGKHRIRNLPADLDTVFFAGRKVMADEM